MRVAASLRECLAEGRFQVGDAAVEGGDYGLIPGLYRVLSEGLGIVGVSLEIYLLGCVLVMVMGMGMREIGGVEVWWW